MIQDCPQMAKELSSGIKLMRQGIPDTMKGFSALAQAALEAGALDTKTKELMALAIGIAVRCDGCIAFHSKAALDQGATRQEVLEVIAMAIYMGGGPSMVYGAQALEAYDQFASRAKSA
ncbi:MAG: carboxymuconolactone decarboxylase family protein [Kiloniellales bacterium]